MLFYSALHRIEAYFATRGVHSANHTIRDDHINNDTNTRPFYKTYRRMKSYSMNARYTAISFTVTDVNT